jgi:hypothetical protein
MKIEAEIAQGIAPRFRLVLGPNGHQASLAASAARFNAGRAIFKIRAA